MATVFDVAAYILEKQGSVPAMKLHKLAYYCQAWSLVWDEQPMYSERIEAWSNGPVVPDLYAWHRGHYAVERTKLPQSANADNLGRDALETIDTVLGFYGEKSAQWLSDLTHREDPWRKARGKLPDSARSNSQITLDSMAEYYSNLQ